MANEIYNTTWWGNAIDTASTAGTNPDFFGSQMKMLTSQQPNQVVNGDFATDSDWSKFNGATISNGKANIIGDGSAFGYIEQLNTFTSGKKYKITLDAVINSGGGLVVKYALGFSANIGSITTSGLIYFFIYSRSYRLYYNR